MGKSPSLQNITASRSVWFHASKSASSLRTTMMSRPSRKLPTRSPIIFPLSISTFRLREKCGWRWRSRPQHHVLVQELGRCAASCAETIVSVERPRKVEAGSIRLAMDAAASGRRATNSLLVERQSRSRLMSIRPSCRNFRRYASTAQHRCTGPS
jgi:hypothetical protein